LATVSWAVVTPRPVRESAARASAAATSMRVSALTLAAARSSSPWGVLRAAASVSSQWAALDHTGTVAGSVGPFAGRQARPRHERAIVLRTSRGPVQGR
jgi:hypothetical protein